MPSTTASDEGRRAYALAREHLASGVSAAARIHASLDGPFMIASGEGSRVWNVDGREYVDLNTSSGASLLGHGHPAVRRAVGHAGELGFVCGHETLYHGQVAGGIS